jgi:Ca2+-transporting ATPase
LLAYGKNELPEIAKHSTLWLFLSQFANPLMYAMIAAAVISFVLEDTFTAWFIVLVMISNAVVSFYQEHKANQSLRTLQQMVRLRARVIREGREREIDAAEVVPGDILVVHAGDKVAADSRILQSNGLKISEAVLTGESRPTEKRPGLVSEEVGMANRYNMAFMGTLVMEGMGMVIVTDTGINTEYGDVVVVLKDTKEEPTSLQQMVLSLSKFIGVSIGVTVGLVVLLGVWRGLAFNEVFETALSLFVSAIPEGLLPGITIVLVLGMRRIIKRKALVRRLASTETLGGVTVICTDKTGTLTEGKMEANVVLTTRGMVSTLYSDRSQPNAESLEVIRIAVLATDAYVENLGADEKDLIIRGNLTEQSLLRLAVRSGIDPYEETHRQPLIESLLFSSERKYAAFLRQVGNKKRLYVLGAPEIVQDRCARVVTTGGEKGDDYNHQFQSLIAQKDTLVTKGYRLVACAYKDIENEDIDKLETLINDLTISGFIAFTDPVRTDVAPAFEQTRKAGIRTVIVTGDNAITARIVAEQIGMKISDTEVMEGGEIENLSDPELLEQVVKISLFARVSPRHKLRIVKAFQSQGQVVAMLGDGVNDAPALKAADIGVAVDSTISAAREVADLVLLDGGFHTVVVAIQQGRIMFQTIRKVFLYLITQDFTSFFVFFASILLGMPLPVSAAQMLLINLVESGLPDLALATEKEDEGVMKEPPRDPRQSILNRDAALWMISVFILGGLLVLVFYIFVFKTQVVTVARTMTMVFLATESLLVVLSLRSFKFKLLRRDIFSNHILTGAVIISFALILLSVYLPVLNSLLGTVPLDISQWLIVLTVNAIEVLALDRLKLLCFSQPLTGGSSEPHLAS